MSARGNLPKRVWQVFVSGYVLVEAESAAGAEEFCKGEVNRLEDGLHFEATDDVTEAPPFARRIQNGDVLNASE